MINSIKTLLETGEQPTPNRVANLSKEKIDSWNYYFEQAYMKGYLKNPKNLMRQKEKSIRMMQEIDKRAAEARRQNRPSAVKKLFRFLSSPLRGPIKIAGKIRAAIEKILPEEVRPIFRVLAGKYMLGKYRTLARSLVAKHATPQLMKALDIWRTVLVVQKNPEIVSKLLRMRLKELGKGEIGKIIARVTEGALGRLPDNAYGDLMRQLLVMQATELNRNLQKSWDKEADRPFDKNDKKLEKKITDLTKRVARVFPDKRLKKELDDAANEFDQYIFNTVAGTGGGDKKKKKVYTIKAAFEAAPTSGVEPLTVEFDASASEGPISKYEWDFADGSKDEEGKKVTHTFRTHAAKEETYEVELSVYAPDDSKNTAKKTITVRRDERLKLKISSVEVKPKKVKAGESITITGAANVQGCTSGRGKYRFYVDGKKIDEKSGDEESLDYDLEYSTTYTIPASMKGGKHKAEFEVIFEITNSEHKGTTGKKLTAKKGASFTVEGKSKPQLQPAVAGCPVPEGAEFTRLETGWYYWLDGHRVGPEKFYYDPEDTLKLYSRGCYDADGNQTGIYEEWYENGKRKLKSEFLKGYKNGKTTIWKKDGTIEKEVEYKEGLRHGVSKFYFDDGELEGIVTYKEDIQHGDVTYWELDMDGKRYKDQDKIYENDKVIFRRRYHKNGQPAHEKTYRRTGKDQYEHEIYYDENGGLVHDIHTLNGKKHGTCIETIEINYKLYKVTGTYDHGKELSRTEVPIGN